MYLRTVICLNTILCLGSTLSAAEPSKPAARAVEVRLNVKTLGAVGDANTDDSPAFQRALNRAGKTFGAVVQVPIGNFLLKSPIHIPAYVTLEGVWEIPTAGGQMKGSTLLAAHGEGDENAGPQITLETCSVLKGVTIFYPGQSNPASIKPFPWCIAGKGENVTVMDCTLVNPYRGIDLGSQPCARHLIQRVYGQPLKTGIWVDQCMDVGRIIDVHFWPFWNWEPNTPIAKWMLENSVAFEFARSDWQYVSNTFCFGYGVAYKFVGSKYGGCNGQFSGIGADASGCAVLVEANSAYGLLISNGEFVSMGKPDAINVQVPSKIHGTVQFNNCAFWGHPQHNALLRGGVTMFSNCHFQEWDVGKEQKAAIRATGGRLIVNGCRFSHNAPQIALGKDVSSAVIMGNLMAGELSIKNEIGSRAQIGLNAPDAIAEKSSSTADRPARPAEPRE